MLLVYLIGFGLMALVAIVWSIWIEIITGLGGGQPFWKYVLMVLTWSIFWPITLCVMVFKVLKGGR